jgi:hypothetical protein
VRAGYAFNGMLYNRYMAGFGLYWASTLYSSASYAHYLGFVSFYVSRGSVNRYRYYGRSVRCVAR